MSDILITLLSESTETILSETTELVTLVSEATQGPVGPAGPPGERGPAGASTEEAEIAAANAELAKQIALDAAAASSENLNQSTQIYNEIVELQSEAQSFVTDAVITHEALPDPHPQYLLDSNTSTEATPSTIVQRSDEGVVRATTFEGDVAKLAHGQISTAEFPLNSTYDPQSIDSFVTTEVFAVEYTAYVTSQSYGKQVSKILVLNDGEVSEMTEFGVLFTQVRLVDFSVFNQGTVTQLMANPYIAGCTVKLVRQQLN